MMKVLTFGELLLRLKPPAHERILQANSFEAGYGGAEANVALSLALLGDEVSYLSKVPDNLLGDAALSSLRRFGVETSSVIRSGNRLGIYFFEKGASIRPTNVVYDRKNSALSEAKAEEFDWQEIFKDIDLFYFSGVTPAISSEMEKAVLEACQYCQEHSIEVVCDLNYRGKMWTPEHAQQFMKKAMKYVTVCLAHDEDFESTLGIKAFDGNMAAGLEQKEQYQEAMKSITEQYPNCHTVASVLRNIYSVEDSEWMGMLYQKGQFYETKTYQVHVMEGVAAGDAFGAGFVHGLIHQFEPQKNVDYAIAASVLKLTISGDSNLVKDEEIQSIMENQGSARLKR
ncbi:sugar kinase [Jeotgalibaca sp. MA1X17-3]|uniref:sugar kinase n=1 Tax=Jeotgalibaca sp. MA1X17-3 TaxID=2908211 RepID=UPI001F24476D|nr:sugar kinase [Jeotgalibaca sp. MA1X17-3]UJF15968.1 sugar kinase [Jeotgalibaca sp. MA1X17-3]